MSNFPLKKIMNNFAYDTDMQENYGVQKNLLFIYVGSWFIMVVEINVQPLNE